jgi:thiol-disulfide isomerase/thioredoxin
MVVSNQSENPVVVGAARLIVLKILKYMKKIWLVWLFLWFGITSLPAQQDTLMPAHPFKLATLNGDTISLAALKGKVVYIDFWASWCGPCIAEMKYSKKLHDKLKEHSDIVFLYISWDENSAAWKQAIEKHKIEGVHANSPNGTLGDVRKYQVKTIPRYVILDKQGNIVYWNAPRPSQNITESILLDLKKQ